ncbi:MAG: hypothetical protein M1421_02530 [Candidatus Eremiobacteraeota bacterium]|nr:hypothetical protein [Candidatus Eremiobacteraeota bacterium]
MMRITARINSILAILLFLIFSPLNSWGKTSKYSNNLAIYLYNMRYHGAYFVKNHQIYLEETNFERTLSIHYKFPKSAELVQSKKLFISLQKAAKYLDSYIMTNWQTGIIGFFPPTHVQDNVFPKVTSSPTIIEAPPIRLPPCLSLFHSA